MVEKRYFWTWIGLISGFTIMMYRLLVEAQGFASDSPPWIYKVLPLYITFLLPIIAGGMGLILDIKITNKNVKKSSMKELKKTKIFFILKYAYIGALVCFIYSIVVSPLVSSGLGIGRSFEYIVLMFPASIISISFLHLFWRVLETPPDDILVIVASLVFTVEGFLVGFIIPNFKSIIAYILQNKKRVIVYSSITIFILVILSFILYYISIIREDLTWKKYGLEDNDIQFCDNIKNT